MLLVSGKRAAAPLAVLIVALSIQGCQQHEKLSAEQREHHDDVDRCVRVRAEAGQSVFGTLSKDCEDMHPDRPTVERRKLMALMEKKALIPADIHMPVLLPDGDCKVMSLRYVELQETAYRHDADPERAESLAEAERIWTAVNAGSCVMPKRSGA
jgi:hypothetical protein